MIANTFIKRPVTAIVISLVLKLSGIICIFNLAVDQYPNISPPSVGVNASYTGADAQTVEQTTTIPIEEQVNGTPGIEYKQSSSSNSGRMNLRVTFDVGTNPQIAALNVQYRVGIAAPLLPAEASKLGATVRASNPDQLMLVAIYSPKKTHDITFLDNYTNTYIQDAILRVSGVGDVQARTDEFAMRIWLDPDKMASYNLMPSEITAALSGQNVYVAAGAVGSPPQNSKQVYETGIIVNSMLSKPEQYEKLIVKNVPGTDKMIYLKDIGRVELSKITYSGGSFVDGNRCSLLMIYQSPGSNALQTDDNVFAKLAELKRSFPSDVDYVVPFESITIIRVSMQEVIGTLLKALTLVALVVFLFLQNWRSTIIPILAIPVSILSTFCFFIPLGFTINTLTLFGFVLAIGIVVDDAIIVVEAVQHYMDERGLSPKDASIHAMKDISAPVIAIALILAAVFVHVGFVPGIVGRLYQQFAITIAISVLISAFVALSLTPALCTLLLRPRKLDEQSKGLDKLFFRFNQWFDRVSGKYKNGVHRGIRNSKFIIVILVCIIDGTVLLFKSKPTGFIPTEDEGRIYVTYDLPEGASTLRSVEVLHQVMAQLDSVPEIYHYAALGGLNVISFASKSNSATIFCQLRPWDERKEKSQQLEAVIAKVQKRLSRFKEANTVVISPPAVPGLGTSAGFSFILEEKHAGGDIKNLEKVLQIFVAAVQKRPEIGRAFSFFTARTPAYQLTIV